MQKKLIITILSLLLVTSACTPHRIDIQQGNKVEPDVLEKIQPGMNRNQVVFLLGTPLLKDAFHNNRWDYIYYFKPGNEPAKQSRVSLFFDGDTLTKIDTSEYMPEIHDKSKAGFESNQAPAASGGGGGGHSH